MSKKQSINYYSDYRVSSRLTNTKINTEKIKLQFSILNAQRGSYLIQAKLNDQEDFYLSEMKNIDSKQTINFQTNFICDFHFEKQQNLLIVLNKNNNPFTIIKTLGSIIGSINSSYFYKYTEEETLVIEAKKNGIEEDLLNVKFNLKAKNLEPNFFINNKIYYFIKVNNKTIYTSSEIQEIQNNGYFELVQIPIHLLKPSYTVSFYNLSNNQLIFSFNRSIQQIKNNKKYESKIQLPNNRYILFEDNSKIIKNYTFIDYIKSGVKIALSIGIDFTGSNGHPLDVGSLHSIQGPNAYERAINSCGKIVGNYDYDQHFPVYGFGAIVNSSYSKEPSMCFNLNFSGNPEIHKIDNIIKIYHDCLEKEKLTFSGPTLFTPLIKKVISKIDIGNISEYHILLILTDGVIDDLQETIDILIEASRLPLSVIIIGIGNADFKEMEILDGDKVPLTSSKGKKRMRDLVQFVPFSKFRNNEERLSMEVLAEIPRQIIEYYQFNDLNPDQIYEFSQTLKVIQNVNLKYNMKDHLQSYISNNTKKLKSRDNKNYLSNLGKLRTLDPQLKKYYTENNQIIDTYKNSTNTLNNNLNSNFSNNSNLRNLNINNNSHQNNSNVNMPNQDKHQNKSGNFTEYSFNDKNNQPPKEQNFNNTNHNQTKNIINNKNINKNSNNTNNKLISGGANINNDTTKKVINKINKPWFEEFKGKYEI